MELRKNGRAVRSSGTISQVVDIDPNGTVELINDDRVIAIFGRDYIRLGSSRRARTESSTVDRLRPILTVAAIAITIFAVLAIAIGWVTAFAAGLEFRDDKANADSIVIELPDPVVAERLIRLSQPEMVVREPAPIVYDVPLSADLQAYIRSKSGTEERTRLVIAMISVESGFDPSAVSSTDDYGLMQINSINHDWLEETLGITNFLDPYQSIDAGTHMIGELLDDYGDVHLALMAYNMGRTGAKRCWNQGIYSSEYSRKIVDRMNSLEIVE